VIPNRFSAKNPSIPQEYRLNFIHLYFDMFWFGILGGSAVSFLSVYAVRLGASGYQIGLLAAVPAIVSLGLSIPAGNWLRKQPVGKVVFWTAALARLGYLLWIPLPWLFANQGQIWALILITLAMGVPMCGLGISFNALFAAAVPPEYRALIVGRRNMIQSLTYMISSIGAGYILDHLQFPVGYQIIFGIGFMSAAMSTVHLFFVRPQVSPKAVPEIGLEFAEPVKVRKSLCEWGASLHLDIWRTPFRKVLLVLLGFHFAQYIALPIFPLFLVNKLHLTDANLGLATAFFYLTVLLGSTQLNRFVNLAGHRNVTAWGVISMCIYPIAMSLSQNAIDYYLISIVGGFAWALVAGAYANYLLEKIPEDKRTFHLAWYNIVLNAAVLLGSLSGPYIANFIGLRTALFSFGVLRLLAGLAILKWG
jgi:MFS family permease